MSGSLWLKESSKEDLVAHWQSDVERSGVPVRLDEGVMSVRHASKADFEVVTSRATYRARRVIIAIGRVGRLANSAFQVRIRTGFTTVFSIQKSTRERPCSSSAEETVPWKRPSHWPLTAA